MYKNIVLNNKFELVNGKIKYKITGIVFDDDSIDVLNFPDSFSNALKTYKINTLSKFFTMTEELFDFINGYHKFSTSVVEEVTKKIKDFLRDLGNREIVDTLSLTVKEANTLNDFLGQKDYISKEYINKNKGNKELLKLIKEYLNRRKIFEYKPGEYITLNGLYKLGYNSSDYSDFLEYCKKVTINQDSQDEYDYHKIFTVKYIKSLDNRPKIFNLGLNDIFYECILKHAKGINNIKIGDSYLFKYMYDDKYHKGRESYINKKMTPTFALRSIIKENNIYDVNELNKWLKDNLFVNVNNEELLKHLINKY